MKKFKNLYVKYNPISFSRCERIYTRVWFHLVRKFQCVSKKFIDLLLEIFSSSISIVLYFVHDQISFLFAISVLMNNSKHTHLQKAFLKIKYIILMITSEYLYQGKIRTKRHERKEK